MKQRITVEQLQELTPEQQARLKLWWKPERGDMFAYFSSSPKARNYVQVEYCCNPIKVNGWDRTIFANGANGRNNHFNISDCLPLLSIGQCIELLLEKAETVEGDPYPSVEILADPGIGLFWDGRRGGVEFIDTLWEAVKQTI